MKYLFALSLLLSVGGLSCQKYFGEFQSTIAEPMAVYSLRYPSDFEYRGANEEGKEWGRGFYRRDRGRLQFVYEDRLLLGRPEIRTESTTTDSIELRLELNGATVHDELPTSYLFIGSGRRLLAIDSTDAEGRVRLRLPKSSEELRLTVRSLNWEILDISLSGSGHHDLALPIKTYWGTQFGQHHANQYVIREWTRDTVDLIEEFPRTDSMMLIRATK